MLHRPDKWVCRFTGVICDAAGSRFVFDGEQIVPGGDDEGDWFIAGAVDLNQDILTGTVPPARGNDDVLFVDSFSFWTFKSFNLPHSLTVDPEQLRRF